MDRVHAVADYPQPPWHTHGDGGGAAYLVPTSAIALPAGLEPMSILGRSSGVLGYLEYRAPSPISYRELFWMPTMVRAHAKRGYWVEKMYVDDVVSMRAGRELWGLPKSLATFEREGEHIHMQADDGTHMTLRLHGFGPRRRQKSKLSTLQCTADGLRRFQCAFVGTVQLGGLTIESLRGGHWESLNRATRVPGLSGALHDFEATMHEAERLGAS